jgi:hypothetical protein
VSGSVAERADMGSSSLSAPIAEDIPSAVTTRDDRRAVSSRRRAAPARRSPPTPVTRLPVDVKARSEPARVLRVEVLADVRHPVLPHPVTAQHDGIAVAECRRRCSASAHAVSGVVRSIASLRPPGAPLIADEPESSRDAARISRAA